ncbi:MAG: hypothetical protein AB7S39_05495 [Gemmatimonadales bacterium]
MKLVRFIARLFGWLLTPVVAWAASFLGAAGMAMVTGGMASGRSQLVASVAGGAAAAVGALLLWLRLLRRSRRLQETLQVAADATPLVITEGEEP